MKIPNRPAAVNLLYVPVILVTDPKLRDREDIGSEASQKTCRIDSMSELLAEQNSDFGYFTKIDLRFSPRRHNAWGKNVQHTNHNKINMKKIFLLCSLALLVLGACNDDSTNGAVTPTPPEPEPGVEVTDEMKARSEELNSEVKVFYDLNRKPSNIKISKAEINDIEARLTFTDEDTILVSCTATDTAPLIGVDTDPEGNLCWAVNIEGKSRLLKDTEGNPVATTTDCPHTSISDKAIWMVELAKPQAPIKDNEGKDLTATGKEHVSLFKSVEETDEYVKVILYDGKFLQMEKEAEPLPDCGKVIAQLNKMIETASEINSYEGLVTKIEENAADITLTNEEGKTLSIPTSNLTKEAPFVGIALNGEEACWRLCTLGQQPWLKDREGNPIKVKGNRPVMGVDGKGFWTVTFEEAAAKMDGLRITRGAAEPWQITDAQGNPVKATSEEQVSMLQDVNFTERMVNILFNSNYEKHMNRLFVPTDKMQQTVSEINANIAKFAELYSKREVMATSLTEEGNTTTIRFTDGTSLAIECTPDAAKPFVGIVAEGDNYLWALTSTEGAPRLETTTGEPVGNDAQPVLAIDKLGFWAGTIGENSLTIANAQGNGIEVSGEESAPLFVSVRADETAEKIFVKLSSEVEFTLPLFVEKAIDLSAAATANSYIVSAEGDYCFTASVRGNGVGSETTAGYDPQIVLTETMSADWLWMDHANLISDVKLDSAKGKISFKASAEKGNAVIALTDNGAVVWSWHIWLSDVPATMVYASGAEFMDRNLGATGTTPGDTNAYGMYYQWGRKDPFYGGTTTETSAEAFKLAREATIVNPAFEAIVWGMEKKSADYATAAAHPMTFYNAQTTSSQDWSKRTKKTLWAAEKTLNDPCPAGYKVPEITAWKGLDNNRSYIDGVTAWDQALYGMTYTHNGQTTWYPAQGSRNYSAGNLIGLSSTRSGNYWSSNTAGANARYFYFQKVISRPGSINSDLDKYRSLGYSVRCCKE